MFSASCLIAWLLSGCTEVSFNYRAVVCCLILLLHRKIPFAILQRLPKIPDLRQPAYQPAFCTVLYPHSPLLKPVTHFQICYFETLHGDSCFVTVNVFLYIKHAVVLNDLVKKGPCTCATSVLT